MAGSLAAGELTAATASSVSLAGATDDAPVRELLRHSVLPGAVRVAFTREPSLAAGNGLLGADDFTLVARRRDLVVGTGRCSVARLMRNGRAARIGYLGALRVEPGTPGGTRLVREGYDLLGGIVAREGVEACFTSIGTENHRARRVLERGPRLGLPAYRRLCDLVTLVAPVFPHTSGRTRSSPEADVAPASSGELVAFLHDRAAAFQLAPAWDTVVWNSLRGHDVTPDDVALVRHGATAVAAGAVWDQRGFRQTVIDGYASGLALARPLLNAVASIMRRPRLPAPGSVLPQGALLSATVRDPLHWPALWNALAARAARRGLEWLAICRDTRDPELPVLRRLLRGREYHTTLYDVRWAGAPEPEPWDGRPFRPEAGLL